MNFAKTFAGCGIASLLFFFGCGKTQPVAAGAAGPNAMPVGVQVVQNQPVNDSSEYVANLKSRASANIMPQVEGQITRIMVKSGDHVTSGATLMEIDPLKQQATVNSQERQRETQVANVRYAKVQLDRITKLANDGVVAKQDLDQAQSNYDAAQATLESLQAQVKEQDEQLRYYQVRSPLDGIVGDIPVRMGDRVTNTTSLTTVDQPGTLEAYVSVPIEHAADLRLGLPVQIVDGSGKVLADSRITFISPEVNDQTQSVLVKSLVENSNLRLRTDQFIRARVIWTQVAHPLIPVLAVSRIGGQPFVFVAESKGDKLVAHQKLIHLGETIGNNYVVLDGLNAGDKLIVSGTQILADGMPVMATPPAGSQSGSPAPAGS